MPPYDLPYSAAHPPPSPRPIPNTSEWLRALRTPSGIIENHSHYWGNDPSQLRSSATRPDFSTGTGLEIYQRTLLPALEAAEHEVLFVTCFWSPSASLSLLAESLVRLSAKALSRGDGSRIRVRLCFSSRSLLQKLFHTAAPGGYTYPASRLVEALGLPPMSRLRGLDLRVKSMFFRPFSVMHPKFVVVDRWRGFMPSCNLSWERWLECCLDVEGPVVDGLVEFWKHFWGRDEGFVPFGHAVVASDSDGSDEPGSALDTILLPSPHHSKLSISIPPLLPFLPSHHPPPTPLNTFLLHALKTAQHSIHILTPNLTSPPVITALHAALTRGVAVTIITNRRLMLLEQLLTAATTTEYEIWKMQRTHLRRLRSATLTRHDDHDAAATLEEAGLRRSPAPGHLRIRYFSARPPAGREEPLRSHVKCTVVDEELVVLGSGNLDRASWFTSQELGVACYGAEHARCVWGVLLKALDGRLEEYFG
ncbi:hypothetical protein MMC26_002019 [Xylographa opegraphella]|nr:hypothetical protein [Xylographa opegraphella]